MTIVFLLTGTEMGGAEKQVLDLARGLRARGHAVSLISLRRLGPLADEARTSGLLVQSLGMSPGVPDPRGIVRLRSLLRALRPDVVHSHLFHANLLARAIRPLVRVPALVCTIHSVRVGPRLWAWAYRLTDRLADLTTIIGHAAAERHIAAGAVPRGRLAVVPNGVDLDRYLPVAELRAAGRRDLGLGDQFVWLAVGRYVPDKDYPTLLKAFADVARAFPASRLLIVGDGPGRPAAEQQARELGITDRVGFLGLRRDVPRLMNAADGYVMSSAWEGLPLVLLEAAAVELPIVATAVGGTGEIVLEGSNGFLVPPGDPGALAGALGRVMRLEESSRRQLGRRGRAHVLEQFGLDRVVTLWERRYEELVGQRNT